MPRDVITRDMVLTDLQAVARRLGVRRVSSSLYRLEGSFSLTVHIERRIGISWSAFCVEAGLLPVGRGVRGIDTGICRCGRSFPIYPNRAQRSCWRCRRARRRADTRAEDDRRYYERHAEERRAYQRDRRARMKAAMKDTKGDLIAC